MFKIPHLKNKFFEKAQRAICKNTKRDIKLSN